MIQKKDLQLFEDVFPQTRGSKPRTRKQIIALAHKVAAALRKERDQLAKEQQNNISSGFFPTSPQ